MRLRFVVVSCLVGLGGALPGLAQQQAQQPAANAQTDAGLKRPVGAVSRPKDGVQHLDLDKAWSKYDADMSNAYPRVRAELIREFDAATAKGDLDAAEEWQAALEKFENAGELPPESETKSAVSAAVADYKKAKEELGKAYESVVKALTMDKKIAKARAVREEATALSNPVIRQQAKPQENVHDPVMQLKSLVRLDELPAKWSELIWWNGMCDCVVTSDGISCDVRKTDSLVSPYIGEIRVVVVLANKEPDSFSNHLNGYARKYVYSEGKWTALNTPYAIDFKDNSIYEIKHHGVIKHWQDALARVLER